MLLGIALLCSSQFFDDYELRDRCSKFSRREQAAVWQSATRETLSRFQVPLKDALVSIEPVFRTIEQFSYCKPVDFDVVVTNLTDRYLTDIDVQIRENSVIKYPSTVRIRSLNPREQTLLRLTGEALPGVQVLEIEARKGDVIAGRGLKLVSMKETSANLCVTVTSSQYAFYVDRANAFEIIVGNNGRHAARDVIVTAELSSCFLVEKVRDDGFIVDGRPTWMLSDIRPGESHKLTVDVVLTEPLATPVLRACAEFACGEACGTFERVLYNPALLLEVIDNEDPVRIGDQVTYTITLTNQSSELRSGIWIEAILQPEAILDAVSSPDTDGYFIEGKRVRFCPIAVLPPRERVTYFVTVRGFEAGDTRFKALFHVDSASDCMSIVEETESTRFFAK